MTRSSFLPGNNAQNCKYRHQKTCLPYDFRTRSSLTAAPTETRATLTGTICHTRMFVKIVQRVRRKNLRRIAVTLQNTVSTARIAQLRKKRRSLLSVKQALIKVLIERLLTRRGLLQLARQ